SVGIHRVTSEQQLSLAVDDAFQYDSKILIEQGIEGREIECSVLGNENPIASVPGEVVTDKTRHSFYSYTAKYIDENGAQLLIPAKLPSETSRKIQQLAIASFKAINCEGMARVDFFLKDDRHIFVNELNTIPGFTKISMYPKLWEASGISYSELINRLIQLALDRFQNEQRLKTSVEI
ncbi:MAG: D-alanine--D-alanine ligase A, partial [bacterium]|nr:D-alanine--D-alanine ligase A [bacterium]